MYVCMYVFSYPFWQSMSVYPPLIFWKRERERERERYRVRFLPVHRLKLRQQQQEDALAAFCSAMASLCTSSSFTSPPPPPPPFSHSSYCYYQKYPLPLAFFPCRNHRLFLLSRSPRLFAHLIASREAGEDKGRNAFLAQNTLFSSSSTLSSNDKASLSGSDQASIRKKGAISFSAKIQIKNYYYCYCLFLTKRI